MSVEKSGGKRLQFHPELKMILVLNAVLILTENSVPCYPARHLQQITNSLKLNFL